MKYAVVQIGGKQYTVKENDVFSVVNLEHAQGSEFSTSDVLLVVDGEDRKVGTPLVKGAKVSFSVVAHEFEPKIRVATYKAKSRVRKVIGHKQPTTTIKVLSIT